MKIFRVCIIYSGRKTNRLIKIINNSLADLLTSGSISAMFMRKLELFLHTIKYEKPCAKLQMRCPTGDISIHLKVVHSVTK